MQNCVMLRKFIQKDLGNWMCLTVDTHLASGPAPGSNLTAGPCAHQTAQACRSVGEQDKNQSYCCSMVMWASYSLLSISIRTFRICNQNSKIFFISAVRIFTNLFSFFDPHFPSKKSAQISILSTPIVRNTVFPVDWCIQIVFFIFLKKTKAHRTLILSCSPTKFNVSHSHPGTAPCVLVERIWTKDLWGRSAHLCWQVYVNTMIMANS